MKGAGEGEHWGARLGSQPCFVNFYSRTTRKWLQLPSGSCLKSKWPDATRIPVDSPFERSVHVFSAPKQGIQPKGPKKHPNRGATHYPVHEPLHRRAKRDPKAKMVSLQSFPRKGVSLGRPCWEKLRPKGPKGTTARPSPPFAISGADDTFRQKTLRRGRRRLHVVCEIH